jgi:hypothetical protein
MDLFSRNRSLVGSRTPDEDEMNETCAICGSLLHRTKNTYASPTIQGRSHASKHHYVPERFFGRSKNRRGTQREGIFEECPWGHEGEAALFCYDCHEELLHNPVLLPEDIKLFANIVRRRGLAEHEKTESRENLARRIKLFREIIRRGLEEIVKEESQPGAAPDRL